MKYWFINKQLCEVFKEFWSVRKKHSKILISPLKVLQVCLYPCNILCNFQGLTHSFVYVNMFWSSEDTLSHLIVPRKEYFSGERMLYFDKFTGFNFFFWHQMSSFILKIVCRIYYYKICLFFRFCCENGKARKPS